MSFSFVDDGNILEVIDSALRDIRRQNGEPQWMYLSAKTRADFNVQIQSKTGLKGSAFIQYNGCWIMPSLRGSVHVAFFDDRQPHLEPCASN